MAWFFALFLIAISANSTGSWSGFVTYVVDGDTLHVRPDGSGEARRVRLLGLDAPEICQAWGPQARDALAGYVAQRRVSVQGDTEDDYGRLLARVVVEQQDLGSWLVTHGHAWSERWRGRAGAYDGEELAARLNDRGLFAQVAPQQPRDFRRSHGTCYPHLKRPPKTQAP